MGWKNIKEHYRIGHIVRVTDAGICIGSGYVHDLIVIQSDGSVRPNKKIGWGNNEDLDRYRREMEADPAKVRDLVATPDTFSADVPVYTYDYDGNIIEKQCEEPGWPHCTHDGECMYENTFSTDRAQVIEWAKANVEAALSETRRSIEQTERLLAEKRARLAGYEAALVRLAA